jgi:hypothetical protein
MRKRIYPAKVETFNINNSEDDIPIDIPVLNNKSVSRE